MYTKFITRKTIKDRRLGLPDDMVSSLSEQIVSQFLKTILYQEAETLLVYRSIRKEVATDMLIEAAISDGKMLAAPKVEGDTMQFYYFSDLTEFEEGSFHVPEPTGGKVAIPDEHTLMVMPGVAFDLERNRIGYGGGYYDKYLAKYPDLATVALAYDCQMVEHLEVEAFDRKPNMIVTESRILL